SMDVGLFRQLADRQIEQAPCSSQLCARVTITKTLYCSFVTIAVTQAQFNEALMPQATKRQTSPFCLTQSLIPPRTSALLRPSLKPPGPPKACSSRATALMTKQTPRSRACV